MANPRFPCIFEARSGEAVLDGGYRRRFVIERNRIMGANHILGIRECEVIQWFVEPGARVEEFAKLCEVQSDKASVEITSRFTGVIKKLHYEAGEMAIVGKPLVDIDIQGEVDEKELEELTGSGIEESTGETSPKDPSEGIQDSGSKIQTSKANTGGEVSEAGPLYSNGERKHASLATPAVRHLLKELDINIRDVTGTGKEGRVLKEDVHTLAKSRSSAASTASSADGPQKETATALNNIQLQMFKTMTRSLTIPHFLYADEIDFTSLSYLRTRLNSTLSRNPVDDMSKISYLPFIIKAISIALKQYPILNARVDTTNASKPSLVMRSQHNIGIAMDTPSGLLVPVIKNVASLPLISIAAELRRLQSLASTGKLTSADLSGGTITLSNVGNIGGTYVAPVIVDKEVAILGIGKTRTVPAFGADGGVVAKEVCNFSWSADHRVVDGATMARAAEVVRGFVEEPDSMMIHLR
jgi:2-oxoisovalerate dehydrogenase E2 component (dihydrolipoyl transacylase)